MFLGTCVIVCCRHATREMSDKAYRLDVTPPVRNLAVITNSTWIAGRNVGGRQVQVIALDDLGIVALIWLLLRGRCDAILVNTEPHLLYRVCIAKKIVAWASCPVMSVDLILTRPRSVFERIRFYIRRWLLKEVDRFVLFCRETTDLRKLYGIGANRVRYVPFKVNTQDRVLATPVADEEFFLACGRSNRDYATLCEAMRGLPYECRILAPWGATREHGTTFEGATVPPNVTLVSDDGTTESWNNWIARARAIVLPIEPGSLSPSGIGTYLVAMALGKAVIITRSPATEGILTEAQAVLIPERDPGALRASIIRVAEDSTYRTAVAQAGKRYALGLGGEERLRDDVTKELAMMLVSMVPDLRSAVEGVNTLRS